MSTQEQPDGRRGIRLRLYLFALVDELGPLLAIYTLWFSDHGIGASRVSVVFALWAGLGILPEIPSGALADRVDRRRLVAVAMGLRATGIAVWLVWPTFAGVIVGAMLWATHTATASGTWEALVYDELHARGETERYAVMMARIGQCSHLGTAAGAGLATLLLERGVGLAALGVITIALHLPAAWAVLSLPAVSCGDHRDDGDEQADAEGLRGWWNTLRLGAREVLVDRTLLLVAVTAALIEGAFIYDEYVPLLGRHRGAPDAWVPVLVLAVWIGLLVGGELAARAPRLRGPWLGVLVGVGVGTAVLALRTEPFETVALLGVTYGAMNTAFVLSEARLQERAPAAARATTRSTVAFAAGIVSTGVFLIVQALSEGDDPTRGLLVSLVLLVAAALLLFRLPAAGEH